MRKWTPRIGHEVVVECLNGDIDQPVVVCSLYNGRGEGGALPTPGGKEHAGARPLGAPFGDSTDARASAQGNLTRGASPAWHGASPIPVERGGQNYAAALSGHKTKELGGAGFNHLVHDDTPGQERLQFATTQHASQLNLGQLIGRHRFRGHQAHRDFDGGRGGSRAGRRRREFRGAGDIYDAGREEEFCGPNEIPIHHARVASAHMHSLPAQGASQWRAFCIALNKRSHGKIQFCRSGIEAELRAKHLVCIGGPCGCTGPVEPSA